MKRIHLFELEDQAWFPGSLRVLITRYLAAIHRLFGTADEVAQLAARALRTTGTRRIHDLCSGHGGPQREVLASLRERHGIDDVHITLSDLFPDPEVARSFNADGDDALHYRTEPVDARSPGELGPGLRTMICSFHHMPPDVARAILADAVRSRQPFLAYEISDNSAPRGMWWTALPFGALMVFALTPKVRPLTLRQILLTYLIPLLPICIGWDGAVSNARTYGLEDLDRLLADLPSDGYRWEKGTFASGPSRRLYLLGHPVP